MAQQFENWRILPDLHKEVGVVSKQRDIPMYELARLAWDAYMGRSVSNLALACSEHHVDPALTPQNEHERAIVAAALAFDREVEAEEVREILYTLLKRWLPKSFKWKLGKTA